MARREDVSRRSVFIKILYNDKEVSRTDSRSLSTDFRVHFGQIFNLKILNCPQSINLQVEWRQAVLLHQNLLNFFAFFHHFTIFPLCLCVRRMCRCLRRLDCRAPSWLRCLFQCQSPQSWQATSLLKNLSSVATREWCLTMRESGVVNVFIWHCRPFLRIDLISLAYLHVILISLSLTSWLSLTPYSLSDVPLSFEADGSNKVTLLTSGKLSCCVSWGIGEDDVPLAPPVSQQPGGIHR